MQITLEITIVSGFIFMIAFSIMNWLTIYKIFRVVTKMDRKILDYSYWRKTVNDNICDLKATTVSYDKRIKSLELKEAQDFGREIGRK